MSQAKKAKVEETVNSLFILLVRWDVKTFWYIYLKWTIQNINPYIWYQDEALAQKTIEAEDIEKMSDSNQDIKDRLSEAVRDNAKHLLDPLRKVNGEPVPAQQPQLFTGGVMRWYQIEGIEWLRVSIALYLDPLPF